jgi:hypothetical protein
MRRGRKGSEKPHGITMSEMEISTTFNWKTAVIEALMFSKLRNSMYCPRQLRPLKSLLESWIGGHGLASGRRSDPHDHSLAGRGKSESAIFPSSAFRPGFEENAKQIGTTTLRATIARASLGTEDRSEARESVCARSSRRKCVPSNPRQRPSGSLSYSLPPK